MSLLATQMERRKYEKKKLSDCFLGKCQITDVKVCLCDDAWRLAVLANGGSLTSAINIYVLYIHF